MEKYILKYLSKSNSLDYDKKELMSSFERGTSEEQCIAVSLCGASGCTMALNFMEGANNVEDFFNNVKFNGKSSNPLILRAINIRLFLNSTNIV